MRVGVRARTASWLVALLLSVGSSALGCHKHGTDKAHEAAVVDADAVKQSLAGLKPRLSALNAKFAALHKQFDPLPPNLPGFGDVRGKFYSTDEGLGIMGAKLTWLSGRLDAAAKSKNQQELRRVAKDVAHTYDELRQIDQIAVELLHRVIPFQKMAAERPANEPMSKPAPP